MADETPESKLPPPPMPDRFQPDDVVASNSTPPKSPGWKWLSRSLSMALIAAISIVAITAQVIAIKTGGGSGSIGVDLDNVIMTSIATLGALGAANTNNQSQ